MGQFGFGLRLEPPRGPAQPLRCAQDDPGWARHPLPQNVLTRDELFDNVMFYWLPAAGASSARMYWERFNKFNLDPIHIPAGCSIFPKDIFCSSRRWAEKRFTRLVCWSELEKGGVTSPPSSNRLHSSS